MADDLIAFLRARLDHEASDLDGYDGSYNDDDGCWGQHVDPDFARADIESKRQIVDRYAWLCEHGDTGGIAWVLPLLALPYADHPEFRADWRP